jgi:hypothetical protein
MKRNGAMPHADSATLQGTATTLNADAIPQPGFATTLNADAATLNADATTQQGFATMLNADAATAAPAARRIMGFRANASMEQRLMAAHIAIETALADPALAATLAAHGYDRARILAGRALRERAAAQFTRQRALSGDQLAATDARDAAWAQAHAVYIRHVATARVALRDDRGAMRRLDLSVRRKKTHAGWLIQASQFYTNALADQAIVAALAAYGVTAEHLGEAQTQVAAVAAAQVTQQQRRVLAQESTRDRDAAFQQLSHWMRDFLAIARIALADKPQLLEQLGVAVARS